MKLLPLLFVSALAAVPLRAGVVFSNGFETPEVPARTPKSAGGDICKPGETQAWSRFEDQPNIGEGGSIVAGLTREAAHSGSQSLFIEAAKLSAPYLGALFATRPIAIEGGQTYKLTLWGRNDAKKPLISGAAQLFLKIQVDFFSDAGGKTEVGDSQYLLQPLPGGRGRPPVFPSNRWNSVGLRFTAPAGARTATVSFRCDSSAERGAISGTIYFDDFTLETSAVPAAPPLEQIEKDAEALTLPELDQNGNPVTPASKKNGSKKVEDLPEPGPKEQAPRLPLEEP